MHVVKLGGHFGGDVHIPKVSCAVETCCALVSWWVAVSWCSTMYITICPAVTVRPVLLGKHLLKFRLDTAHMVV